MFVVYPRVLAILLLIVTTGSVQSDSLDHWTVRASGTGKNLYGVIYGSHRFVIVGQNGTILVSTNGAAWNVVSNTVTVSLYEVAWGKNLFIAVGDSGAILTSSDANTWSQQTSPVTNDLRSVRFLNDNFITLGAHGTLLTSSDGISWVARDSGSAMTLEGAAFGKGISCGVGGGTTQNSSIVKSFDGLVWSNQPVSFNYLYDVSFGNDVFVVQGVRGQVRVSNDALTWALYQAGDADYLFGATFAQGLFVAVGGPFGGGKQKIVTSPDGVHWQTRPVTTGLSPPLRSVCYGNGSFVSVGEKGIILQSDPVFHLQVASHSAGSIQWLLTGEEGRSYRLQSSASALTGWTDLTNFIGTGETTILEAPSIDTSGARFYRIVSP